MSTTTTYEQILNFRIHAAQWLTANKEKERPTTKFGYALHKMDAKAEKAWARYQAKLEDLRVEHCAVDEKGVILSDEKTHGYKFTKEGLKALNAANEKLLQETPVELEPHFATRLPRNPLSPTQAAAFLNFVLAEDISEEPQEDDDEAAGVSSKQETSINPVM